MEKTPAYLLCLSNHTVLSTYSRPAPWNAWEGKALSRNKGRRCKGKCYFSITTALTYRLGGITCACSLNRAIPLLMQRHLAAQLCWVTCYQLLQVWGKATKSWQWPILLLYMLTQCQPSLWSKSTTVVWLRVNRAISNHRRRTGCRFELTSCYRKTTDFSSFFFFLGSFYCWIFHTPEKSTAVVWWLKAKSHKRGRERLIKQRCLSFPAR